MVLALFQDERIATMQALDEAWQDAYHVADFDPQTDRYVIMSDLHKGDRRPSDDFQRNEFVYCHALQYYLRNDFRLILNGDVEEGWECDYHKISAQYKDTAFAMEREFVRRGAGYYLRTFGNHDHDWRSHKNVEKHLWPLVGQIQVYEAIRLGDHIFLIHGHQGQPFDDPLRFPFSNLVIRYIWAPIVQGLLGLGGPSASKNKKIRKKRDKLLYEWARRKRQLLIAGHTHEAMFQSASRAGQLQDILEHLKPQHSTALADRDYELLAAVRKLNTLVVLDLLAEDQKRRTPNYFNAGCCIYSDGITGIEIDRGVIRLVKWEISDAYPDCRDNNPTLNIERHPRFGFYIMRRIYQQDDLLKLLDDIRHA